MPEDQNDDSSSSSSDTLSPSSRRERDAVESGEFGTPEASESTPSGSKTNRHAIIASAAITTLLLTYITALLYPRPIFNSISAYASTLAAGYFAFFLIQWRQKKIETAARSKGRHEEMELSNFGDLPAPAQELIRHLRTRYDESFRMYERSLRSSPILFAAGVIAAMGSATSIGIGVWLTVHSALVNPGSHLHFSALLEIAGSSILLGIMATGFFSWRRDIHKFSLNFFDDMIYTRSIQSAIRMLASMRGWVGEKPDAQMYLKLLRLVATRRPLQRSADPEDVPKGLSPNVVEKGIEAAKTVAEGVRTIVEKSK